MQNLRIYIILRDQSCEKILIQSFKSFFYAKSNIENIYLQLNNSFFVGKNLDSKESQFKSESVNTEKRGTFHHTYEATTNARDFSSTYKLDPIIHKVPPPGNSPQKYLYSLYPNLVNLILEKSRQRYRKEVT